jgi:hypothetical protein
MQVAFDVADANDEMRAVIITGGQPRRASDDRAGCQARAAETLRLPWNRRRVLGYDRV